MGSLLAFFAMLAPASQPPPVNPEPSSQASTFDALKAPAFTEQAVAGYQLLLEGTTKDKTATASATWKNAAGTEMFGIRISGPLDEGGEGEPLTLDGLAASASAQVTYQHFIWGDAADAADGDLQDLACDVINRGSDGDCDRWHFVDDSGHAVVVNLADRFAAAEGRTKDNLCHLARLAGRPCSQEGLRAVDLERAFLRASGAKARPVIVGLTATVGRRAFRFLESGTLDARSENHNDWAVGGFVGRYSPRSGYLAARVQFRREFAAAGAAFDICRPIAGTDALRCRPAVIGGPGSDSSTVGALEWRRFLPGGNVAVNPRILRNFERRVTAVELPIYFLGSDKGLTGGLRIGWRSDTEEVTVAVFVGGTALKTTDR